jgi:hypothetical protein
VGFPQPGLEMMEERRTQLGLAGHLAELAPISERPVVQRFALSASEGAAPHEEPPTKLVSEVATALGPRQLGMGSGCVLVSGLSPLGDLPTIRRFSKVLLHAVWAEMDRQDPGRYPSDREFRVSSSLTSDGRIPHHLYGTAWTLKPLHQDRDPVLFAHVYGPCDGYTGGEVLVVDAISYLHDNDLSFDETFTWTDGKGAQKPLLREEHREAALATHGADLGRLGPDAVLLVNNSPAAGVLHGARPVVVLDRARFSREVYRSIVCEPETT